MVNVLCQDRRIRRTRRQLAQALISLSLLKGYEAITIRDITGEAAIGYATFFRHYRDKDGLLQDVLNVVLDEIISLLAPSKPESDFEMVGSKLFHYVQEHSELIQVLLTSQEMSQRVLSGGIQRLRADSYLPVEPEVLKMVDHHIVSSSMALIDWWLGQGMPYAPERMGLIFNDLIMRPAINLLTGCKN